jgi:hypothetical protein
MLACVCGFVALAYLPPFFGAAGLILAAIGKSRGERQAVIGFTVAGIGLVFGALFGAYVGYQGGL